jgi:hypothetical protein
MAGAAAAPDVGLNWEINGKLCRWITGVDMLHIILLLPQFDLMDHEISNHNIRNETDHSGPACVLWNGIIFTGTQKYVHCDVLGNNV